MDSKQFFEEMQGIEVPDKMAFQIKSADPNPEHTFSAEGIETLFDNIRRFIGARMISRMQNVGPPKEINVIIDIEWAYDENTARDEVMYPWWSLVDEAQPLPDGERRERGTKQ